MFLHEDVETSSKAQNGKFWILCKHMDAPSTPEVCRMQTFQGVYIPRFYGNNYTIFEVHIQPLQFSIMHRVGQLSVSYNLTLLSLKDIPSSQG